MDWGKLPDLVAVTLLASAFSAVARKSQASVSTLWLTGWVMIAVHFGAFMFLPAAGRAGAVTTFIGLISLAWAGILFNWASVPDRDKHSSWWMLGILMGTNTLYLVLIVFAPSAAWALKFAAVLFGILPLTFALVKVKSDNHSLRWATVLFHCILSAFLLIFQSGSDRGAQLATNAVLFTVYFGCSIHFWYAYRRASTGALITITGFLGWSAVFVLAPSVSTFFPTLHLEDEVWNLPKYVVAVGMILLLLEDQIEHNKYLALHDELTGLPNRRLFHDRLTGALERARRTGSQAALLLVDLDQFKQVNDTYGHHAGDQLLEHVGNVLSGRVRRSDTVARTGGDEFAVILDEPTSREDAERVSRSLVELLNEPFNMGEQSFRVGASVGIAIYPEDASDAEALCIAADLRMYDSKRRHSHFNPTRPIAVASVRKIEATPRLQNAE